MALSILRPQPCYNHLLGIEWATLAYTFVTSVLAALLWERLSAPAALIESRLFVVLALSLVYWVYRLRPTDATLFVRQLFPLTLLGFWYPDTYEYCQVFPNLDHVFAEADQWLFGYQPALAFSQALPSKWWSEIFHLGYFSYYPLISVTVLAPLFTDRHRFGKAAFIVLTGFLLYYLIYLFLPVTGPQYYFQAIGPEAAESGHFAAVGDYFRYHAELRPSPAPDGFFQRLVETTQASGERPTAAFPSSHVGMSTILMLLLWHNNRRIFICAAPFYVALCCATVYIEAHYFIDVVGGLLSAILIYPLCCAVYRRWVEPREAGLL